MLSRVDNNAVTVEVTAAERLTAASEINRVHFVITFSRLLSPSMHFFIFQKFLANFLP